MIFDSFNPLTLPLQGTRLIEASAGTGKTYNLTVLYLRLLLGLGGETAYPRPLSVEEILVVTFTDTATKELRSRIRANIHLLMLACMRGESNDSLLAAILVQISDRRLAALHLLAAERQMDNATIYTIHSFCKHILNNAVTSNILFPQTFLDDESCLYQQVSAEFWRSHCHKLPLEVARMVQQYWEGPANLLAELLPYLQGELPMVCNPPDITESILARHARIIAVIADLKQQWRTSALELMTLLESHKLDRRIYSSNNLRTWLAKIDYWVSEPTVDDQVPNELARFKSSVLEEQTTDGEPPRHELFAAVEAFYQSRLSLRELIFSMALIEIRQALKQEKQRRDEIGFDDLLSRLDQALAGGSSGAALAESVRKRYPVAIIDEFQDTDPQQYRIFRQIYVGQSNCGMLLMGDPKQAIYAFRGADIFTYMCARNEVDAHYTLDTNWRSSPGMINAVNHLFQSLPSPFIFSDIPFLPVMPATVNQKLRLVVQHQPQPALRIWLQPGAGVGISEYKQYMARQCAATIQDLLCAACEGKAWLEGRLGKQQLIQASDITVLVRNRSEAALVYAALAELLIPAVQLSNRDSVFNTPEARELQWILQAVLTTEKKNELRRALATCLLGLNATAIDTLNNDERLWNKMVEDFAGYRQHWQKHGILPMLRKIMVKFCIAESLLASQGGERRLTNLLHLGELLQEASTQIVDNEFALVRWLALQVASPNSQETNQQLRLENDRHLVQIMTVHKSKGLEFPLVFLPFAADFRVQKRPLFHDRDKYGAWLDLSAAKDSLLLAEEERLAEDVRLLYVALTRSIYHCSIGIAPLYRGSRKKSGISDLHLSALGYLVQQGQDGNVEHLHERLADLVARASGDIFLCDSLTWPAVTKLKLTPTPTPLLQARSWPAPPKDIWSWKVTSGMQLYGSSSIIESQPRLDVDALGEKQEERKEELLQLTPHTFPRGAVSGTFLHGLFKNIDFNRPLDQQYLSDVLTQKGIKAIWLPVIMHWIKSIITIPLDGYSLSLNQLTPASRYAELSFYLPIDAVVQAHKLDRICKRYDPLSARCPPLDFLQFRGMLKGYIDLVFRWQGRYYLLEYKSNWLGEDIDAYTRPAIEQAMITHRYVLQYQLYALALHRFLGQRLLDYNYQRDFGGIYYLFMRGIDLAQPENGLFYCRPDIVLVEELNNLFIG